MKYLILSLSLFILTCCSFTVRKYPGHQKSYEMCHNLWDFGYNIDVAKCEHGMENQKYKVGQKVKSVDCDKDSDVIIKSPARWNPISDELTYDVLIYSHGNLLGEYAVSEKELYTGHGVRQCRYTR